jgi:hypothetical protein
VYLAEPVVFDDGPVKPVRIWSRVGRQPILAAGNSNGDVPMLAFASRPSRPGLRLVVLHDDPERELDYVAGATRRGRPLSKSSPDMCMALKAQRGDPPPRPPVLADARPPSSHPSRTVDNPSSIGNQVRYTAT